MNYATYMGGTAPSAVGGVAAAQPFTTPPPQIAPTASAVQSVYGEQRPTFSADGSGVPYTSVLNVAESSLNQNIGYDTNSKDPVMVRSRVFIGRLGSAPITRDDLITLFKPFGTILALNHFKQGFGFVQFSQPSEADASVNGLNGKKWMGVIIDVHHVDLATQAKKRAEQESAGRKRANDDNDVIVSKLLRATELGPLDEIKQQNRLNRVAALGDSTGNEDLFDSEMADTLICGACRYVTADFENFKNHRIIGCQKRKEEDEPMSFKCSSCDGRFKSAWAILCHLTEFHRMMLYKVEEEQEQSKDQQKMKNEESKKLKPEDCHNSATPEPSPIKPLNSKAETPKSDTFSQFAQQPSTSQQQQSTRQQPESRHVGSVCSSNYASSSQTAYTQSSYAQSEASRPAYVNPTYSQSGYSQLASYSQIPTLGSTFTVPQTPQTPKESIITAAPVRYPSGSASSSR